MMSDGVWVKECVWWRLPLTGHYGRWGSEGVKGCGYSDGNTWK